VLSAVWGTGVRGHRLSDPLPMMQPGAFSGQRKGWKTPRKSPGDVYLLYI